jgi:hypothetical protein
LTIINHQSSINSQFSTFLKCSTTRKRKERALNMSDSQDHQSILSRFLDCALQETLRID